jgi:hypothetical protein
MDSPVVDWLLEKEDPGVRHAALTTLLGRRSDDPDVCDAQEALMQVDPVRTILMHQEPEGHWRDPSCFYESKYRGTAWQVILCTGADETQLAPPPCRRPDSTE